MKKSSLKKKLFIAGANLLVLLALLIYVSYSAYRLRVAAELEMMEAARMRASIDMTYDLTNGPVTDPAIGGYPPSQLVLDELLPGEKASEYAADPQKARDKGREVSFKVISKASASEATLSEVPMCFKVVIEETGPIPLEIILKDEDTGKIVGTAYTGTEFGYDVPKVARFYATDSNAVYKAGEEPEQKECVFFLNNLEEDHVRNLKLYFGWNNELKTSYVEANRREVSIINVKAEITQAPPVVIETPVPASPSTVSELHVYKRVNDGLLGQLLDGLE